MVMKIKSVTSIFLLLLLLSFLFPPTIIASTNFIAAVCTTGGGVSCLDGVHHLDVEGNGTNIPLATGDIAVVSTSSNVDYHYRYDSTSGLAESDPIVIAPDSIGAGTGRWILSKLPIQAGGTGGDDAEEARTNLEINMSHLLSPDADSVFTMANYTMTYNWTTANPSSEIVFRKFDYAAEPDDADVIFFRHLAGDSNTIFWQCIGTVADGVVCGGDVLLNIESVNLLDGTDYMVGGYQIDHDDLAGLAPVKGGLPTVDKSASDSSLDPAEVLNTMINNDDSSAQVTLGLPAAVLGYAFIGFVAEAYKFCFDPNGSEIIVLDGVAQTGGNMVCSETTPTVGDEINCAVFDDGGTKKWRCVSILGTWSDGGA